MKAPSGLKPAGRAVWRQIVDDLPEGWELDGRERRLLTLACRQADDLAALERSIAKHGAMTVGASGQAKLNPAVTEARQARLAVARVLGQIGLPDEEEQPRTEASRRAQHAANVRHDLDAQRKARRGTA